jgi:hypothetical protein
MNAQTRQTETTQQDVEIPSESKLEIIKFNKIHLQCFIDPDGSVHVALKPIINAIGLHADSAWLGIKNDPILGAKHSVRRGLDAKNRRFPMQTLPMQYVHGWLFQIDVSKVSANAKPKLLKFKQECYQVLFDHFFGKYKVYEHNLRTRQIINQRVSELDLQIHELRSKRKALTNQLRNIELSEISGQLQLISKGGNV